MCGFQSDEHLTWKNSANKIINAKSFLLNVKKLQNKKYSKSKKWKNCTENKDISKTFMTIMKKGVQIGNVKINLLP